MIQRYLDAMALIEAVSAEIGTTSYIWGGWTLDIHEGRPLRAHGDVDCFVIGLHQHLTPFSEWLQEAGWEVKIVLNGHLLSARKEGVKLQLGHVEIHGDVAHWKHNGNQGTILFPAGWLGADPAPFLGVTVHIAGPELGYVLKTNPSLMNPNWRARDKDRADIDRLRDLLLRKQVDLDALPSRVKSI